METNLTPEEQINWRYFVREALDDLKNGYVYTSGQVVLEVAPSFLPSDYLNVNYHSDKAVWDYYYWDPGFDFNRIFQTKIERLRFKFGKQEPAIRHISGVYEESDWNDVPERVQTLHIKPFTNPEAHEGMADGTRLLIHLNSFSGYTTLSWQEGLLPDDWKAIQHIADALFRIRETARKKAALLYPADNLDIK